MLPSLVSRNPWEFDAKCMGFFSVVSYPEGDEIRGAGHVRRLSGRRTTKLMQDRTFVTLC